MNTNEQLVKIRTKKLAVLIRDSRLARQQSKASCAASMGLSVEQYTDVEQGERPVSLPQVESLAYFLDIPLEHFWGSHLRSEPDESAFEGRVKLLLPLRDRIIAAGLRMARLEAGITEVKMAEVMGVSGHVFDRYESGEKPIPVPELELAAGALGKQLQDFFDAKGPIGEWRSEQELFQQFCELPPEMQEFAAKAVNRPYMQLAMRLSSLNVEKLRMVAEGLLEITY